MRPIVTQGLCYLFVASLCLGAIAARGMGSVALESLDRLAWGGFIPAGEGTPSEFPDAVAPFAAMDLGEAGGPLWFWVGQALADAFWLAILVAVLGVVWRRRRLRELRLLTLYEVTPAPEEGRGAAAWTRETPRFLPINPYLDPSAPRRLSRQIENAAEASLEFHRVFGLLYFDLGEPPAHEDAQAVVDWAGNVSELVTRLKGALRPTDYVVFLNEREIVACIALLPGMTELIGIGERLRRVGQGAPAFAEAFAREAGLAIYPLCGYGGEELVAHARDDYCRRNAPRLAGPSPGAPRLRNAVEGQS